MVELDDSACIRHVKIESLKRSEQKKLHAIEINVQIRNCINGQNCRQYIRESIFKKSS